MFLSFDVNFVWISQAPYVCLWQSREALTQKNHHPWSQRLFRIAHNRLPSHYYRQEDKAVIHPNASDVGTPHLIMFFDQYFQADKDKTYVLFFTCWCLAWDKLTPSP